MWSRINFLTEIFLDHDSRFLPFAPGSQAKQFACCSHKKLPEAIFCGVSWIKSEPFMNKILMQNFKQRIRQDEAFFWAFVSSCLNSFIRPQEGSGKECGRSCGGVFAGILSLVHTTISSMKKEIHPRHSPRTFPLGLLAPKFLCSVRSFPNGSFPRK